MPTCSPASVDYVSVTLSDCNGKMCLLTTANTAWPVYFPYSDMPEVEYDWEMNKLTIDKENKIKNVMKKVVSDAPNEVLIVLDGSTGQHLFWKSPCRWAFITCLIFTGHLKINME